MNILKVYTIIAFVALNCHITKGQQTIPYATGFDTPTEQAGWQFFKLGVDATYGPWSISAGGFSNPNCIHHDYNNTDTVEDWYVSPALNITEACKLSLKIRPFVVSGTPAPTDYIGIWYSAGNGDPNTGQFIEVANLTALASSSHNLKWLDTTVNLPFTAGTGFIGFKYKNVNNWFTISLDNIKVNALTSGINQIKTASVLPIYPNPGNGLFNLILPKTNDVASIEVYNSFGTLIFKQKSTASMNEINLSNQANGLYIIKVIHADKTIATQKIIKQ